MDTKFVNDFEFDTAKNKYTFNGKDIGHKITSIDININNSQRDITINFAQNETAISGKLVPNEYLKPVYCSCGEKLCDYSFDCTLYCEKCGKKTTVIFGQSD